MAQDTPTIDELLALRERLPAPAERRAIRERLGLSRETVARELGVTQDALFKWEKGQTEPRAANLAAYVALLDRFRSVAAARWSDTDNRER